MSTHKKIVSDKLSALIQYDIQKLKNDLSCPLHDFGVVGKLAAFTPVYVYDIPELEPLCSARSFGFTDGYTLFLSINKLKDLNLDNYFACLYQAILQTYLQKDVQELPKECYEYLNPKGLNTNNSINYSNINNFYPIDVHSSQKISNLLKGFQVYELLNGENLSVTETNQFLKDCILIEYAKTMVNQTTIDAICLQKAQNQNINLEKKNISFNTFIEEAKKQSSILNQVIPISDAKYSYQEKYIERLAMELFAIETTQDVNHNNIEQACYNFTYKIGETNTTPLAFEFFIKNLSKRMPSIFENHALKQKIIHTINKTPHVRSNDLELVIQTLTLNYYINDDYGKTRTAYKEAQIKKVISENFNDIDKITDFLYLMVHAKNKEIKYIDFFYKEMFKYFAEKDMPKGYDEEYDEENEIDSPEIKKFKKQREKNIGKILSSLKERDLIPIFEFDENMFDNDLGANYEKFIFEFILKRKNYFLDEGYFPEQKNKIDKKEVFIGDIQVLDKSYDLFEIDPNYYSKNKEEYKRIITDYIDNIPEMFKIKMIFNAVLNKDMIMKDKFLSLLNEDKLNAEESVFSDITDPSLYFEFDEDSDNKKIVEKIIFDYIKEYPEKAIKNINLFLSFKNQNIFKKLFSTYPQEVKIEMENILNITNNKNDETIEIQDFIKFNKEKIEKTKKIKLK